MLSRLRAVFTGLCTLALTLVYWTVLGTIYGIWERSESTGQTPSLAMSDLRGFFILGAYFMALSGYLITVTLLFAFYGDGRSSAIRALMNAALFLLHIEIFAMFFGSSPPGGADLYLIGVGLASVLAAEASMRALRRRSGVRNDGSGDISQ